MLVGFSESLVVVEDPEFGLSIVGTSGQKPVLEWGPSHVLDGAIVSLDKGNRGIKGSAFLGAEDCDSRGA